MAKQTAQKVSTLFKGMAENKQKPKLAKLIQENTVKFQSQFFLDNSAQISATIRKLASAVASAGISPKPDSQRQKFVTGQSLNKAERLSHKCDCVKNSP